MPRMDGTGPEFCFKAGGQHAQPVTECQAEELMTTHTISLLTTGQKLAKRFAQRPQHRRFA